MNTSHASAHIVLLPGDGIGPEVTAAAVACLEAVAEIHGFQLRFSEHAIGGVAIDACGTALPETTRAACIASDAVLLGAVGGPKWSDPRAPVRPEQGLLALRAAMGVYANLRPVQVHPRAAQFSPLRPEKLRNVDLLFVRELTGGIYFGAKTRDAAGASDLCSYSVAEIERVLRRGFALARQRRRKLTSVDKANVMETSRLWRETAQRLAAEYPDVQVEHQLVDSMAMLLLTRPADFDVIVSDNLFGDILTDEAAAIAGSLGLLPSASLGDGPRGLYEPIHGSAPDIAGRGIANPAGAIASAALLLRHSLGMQVAAGALESALWLALDEGVLTPDLGGHHGTVALTDAVIGHLWSQSAVDTAVVARA
ncbi:3-isopropylmalate dehydrogenase [Metallibacterium scheffleri]